MSDAAALLAAIRAAPDDDAPRLVYAEWLDDHGQPERAEFIRVQCELARRESAELRKREAELLKAYHDAFSGPMVAPHLRFRFERGFIVGFGHTGIYVADDPPSGRSGNRIFRFYPEGVLVGGIESEAITPAVVHGIRPGHRDHFQGTYIIDSFTTAAELQLACKWKNDFAFEFDFKAPGTVLVRTYGDRRETYQHHPVSGADTFTHT